MTARERGFLLLTSHLGDPCRKVLTYPQLRILAQRVRSVQMPDEDRNLRWQDLVLLGYGEDYAKHIVSLLSQEIRLDRYLRKGEKEDCFPITRANALYPNAIRRRLGDDAPGCLWAKGDISLLRQPTISLVGSRKLSPQNRRFAANIGSFAAERGLVLVSGNASGADTEGQNSCLASGGCVISVVADQLSRHPMKERVLYLSEEDYDGEFSSQRALSRNRCIHAFSPMTFVAQSGLGKGGTWDGTVKNLRSGWSSVACFRDGSESSLQLEQMGAFLIGLDELADLDIRFRTQQTLFD